MSKTASIQKQVEQFINDLDLSSPKYLLSSDIVDESDLSSSKQVGHQLSQLADGEWEIDGVNVERWGYSTGTRWKIERTDA